MSVLKTMIKITIETEIDGKLETRAVYFQKDHVRRTVAEIKDYLGIELVPIVMEFSGKI